MKKNTPIQSSCDDIEELLQDLQEELKFIKIDLANARKCDHDVGPLYTAKTNVENQIKVLEARLGKISTKSKPCHPDLTQTQTILATSSVRRKSDEAKVRNTENLIS